MTYVVHNPFMTMVINEKGQLALQPVIMTGNFYLPIDKVRLRPGNVLLFGIGE